MRVPGRFWWMWALIACAAPAGTIVTCVWFLGGTLPLDREIGQSSSGTLALAALLLTEGMVIAVVGVSMSVRERRRFRQRKAALRGDMEAMPLVDFVPGRVSVPDLSSEPLVLLWSATRKTRFIEGPLQVVGVLIESAIPLFVVVGLSIGIVTVPQKVFNPPDLATFLEESAGFLGAVAALVGLALWLRGMPPYFGRPYGVMAIDDGIECRTQFGRRYLVRWHEVRLFEIEGPGRSELSDRRFRVYGERRIAEWHDQPLKYHEYAPHEMTPAEMARRLDAMVEVIYARMRLAPRTLSKRL